MNAPSVDENGEVPIHALAHGERRAIRIRHRERKLGAFLALSAEDAPKGHPLVVTIRPFGSVAGRFVDGWGDPVTGHVELGMTTFEVDMPLVGTNFRRAEVDAQGRFRIDDLLPGEGFAILSVPFQRTTGRRPPQDVIPPHRLRGGFPFLPIGLLKIEPGGTTDMGTIDVDAGRRVEEPAQAPPPKARVRLVRVGASEAR